MLDAEPNLAPPGAPPAEPNPGAPRFDRPVPPDGYCWWYVDGVSDDGTRAITLIGFLGSVFSPYYAWAGRRDPIDHAAINVALYGRGGRWAMTERRRGAVQRAPGSLTVGPSRMAWGPDGLTIDIAETAVPHLTALRGQVRLLPEALTEFEATLDPAGRHRWRPYAPRARIEVAFTNPALRWSGHGYFDANFGTAALEADFLRWDWSRARLTDRAAVFYEGTRTDGSALSLALGFDRQGAVHDIARPEIAALPRTLWRVSGTTRSDTPAQVALRMEDAPFYSRRMLRTTVAGESAPTVHETLDLTRFRRSVVKLMLPFRMPRTLW